MIIWIASYPKCGNTWVRSLLSAYYFSKDGKFNFNLLKNIKQFPSSDFFEKQVLSIDEAARNWLPIQRKIKETRKVYFLKTHNVFGAYKGNNFTTSEFTLGAINIVRDPRNVVTSLMNHYSINEEEAVRMLSSVHRNLKDRNNRDDYSNYSFISSWAKNYKSWKTSKDINKLLIRYEDLENNRAKTFSKILDFTNKLMKNGQQIDKQKLEISIKTTNFDILKNKEKREGFDEAVYSEDLASKKPFFNLGKKNNYKKLLKTETIKSIEKLFENEMKELGYL